MSSVVEMRVDMDCAGCESKVKSALQKMKGVDTVEIDFPQQKVTVTGWADQKKILKKVRRTGRRAELWQLPYAAELNGGLYDQHHFNGPVNYFAAQPSSHYNYYKHGAGSSHGRYYHTGSSVSFGNHTSSAFSDDNPHACHVM